MTKVIRALKSSKAKDEFGLDANFLKTHLQSIIKPIMRLLNLSMTQSWVPSAWKMTTVTPIFESDSRTDVINYQAWFLELENLLNNQCSESIVWCFHTSTTVLQIGAMTLGPVEQLNKRALKVLDQRAHSYHHCDILVKYHFLSFDNLKYLKHVCAIYKSLHGLDPPPLRGM